MNKLCISALILLGTGQAFGQNKEKDNKEKELETVVLVGSRVAARSNVSTPLPIDGVDASIIQSTGQPTMDKALQYRIPSFNATSAAVQDAQSLLDPYEIRNLGASRTLVLVNGKRKNTSSILFLQPTIGKGETGADLSAIPSIAIKRIDILRDGASAQYGSDAIAGVMNVILKDKINFTEVNTSLGLYSTGDGFSQNLSAITGQTFNGGSWFTLAAGLQNSAEAKRSGIIDPIAEADATLGFGDKAASDAYLKKYPDGNNRNILPSKIAVNFLFNGAYQLSANTKIYGNSAMVVKYVKSTANHRQPYWKSDPDFILHQPGEDFIGFSPTFEGDMRDHSTTLGLAHKSQDGWHIDTSATVGGNQVVFSVNNTYNSDLGNKSPKNFKPGGYAFDHILGNIDINKRFNDWLGLAVGAEARHEAFEIMAGDAASQYGSGSISFPGMNTADAGKFSRNNIGVYADAAMDLSKDFLLNLTGRFENYSDFGNAFVWKTSARWKAINDALVFRASASTGFKAPSLHQINTSTKQASFEASVPGGIVIDGISRNNSALAIQNQIPKLTAEKALNFTFGVGSQISKNFNVTLDGYFIAIKDRILLSSRLKNLDPALQSVSFFINGINTDTYGLDLVTQYKNINLAGGKLAINLAANYNKTEIKGENAAPKPVLAADSKAVMFNRTEASLITSSRPTYKAVFGVDYVYHSFGVSVNNTLFGPAKFASNGLTNNAMAYNDASQKATYLAFKPRVLTDLNLSYKINQNHSVNLNVINILNITPKWDLENVSDADYNNVSNAATFNGRYPQSGYDSQHFSIFGTQFMLGYNFKF